MIQQQKKEGKARRRRGRKQDDGVVVFEKESNQRQQQQQQQQQPLPTYKPHKSLLLSSIQEGEAWYDAGSQIPGRNDTISSSKQKQQQQPVSSNVVSHYRQMADMLFKTELQLYHSNSRGKDDRWVENTIQKGTLKDRTAAMSVVVSTDPVHKLHSLDQLLQMAGCQLSSNSYNHNGRNNGSSNTDRHSNVNARVAQMAAEALQDLFLNTLLPSDRKLVTLEQRPFGYYHSSDDTTTTTTTTTATTNNNGETTTRKKSQKTLSPRVLLLWRYEEMIKERYHAFVTQFIGRQAQGGDHGGSGSGMDLIRIFFVFTACSLLKAVPEGEATLLSIVVNKLGDPSKKTATAAAHELRRVLVAHPNMTTIVAREVQQVAHRPHLSPRALYNCIIFLNQLKLFKSKDDNDDDNNNSNMESSLSSLPASLVKTYFRLFEVAIIKASSSSSQQQEAAGLKGRLLSALLTGVNRAHPYLNGKEKALDEHVDALYRIVHTAPPAACTQALLLLFYLVSDVQHDEEEEDDDDDDEKAGRNNNKSPSKNSAKTTPTTKTSNKSNSDNNNNNKDRFYRALYATLSNAPLVSSGKHLTLYFNLLYKAMKYDSDGRRVVAFATRLVCTTMHSPPPVVAASLFLLSEVLKVQPLLRESIHKEEDSCRKNVEFDFSKREPRASFIVRHKSDATTNNDDDEDEDNKDNGDDEHDDKKLVKSAWETALLKHHFHPSVAKFTHSLGAINYGGDPLKDFGLAPFLDKFAYRNPKQAAAKKQQQQQKQQRKQLQKRHDGMNKATTAVNDPKHFASNQDIPEDEEFYHKFFVERASRDELKGITQKEKEDSEAMLEKAKRNVARRVDEEDGWDTDPEEEEFVNRLAESLMKDGGNSRAHFDDEDPDMEGWGDDNDDDDDDGDNDRKDIDFSAMDGFDASKFQQNESDEEDEDDDDGDSNAQEDDFMDAASSSEDDDSDEEAGRKAATSTGARVLVQNDSDDDDDDDDGDDDEEDDALFKMLGQDDDMGDSEDELEEETTTKKSASSSSSSSSKKKPKLDVFADASEYEDMINEGWMILQKFKSKRKKTSHNDNDDDDDDNDDDNVALDGMGSSDDEEQKAKVRNKPSPVIQKKTKKRRKNQHA